MPWKRPGGKVRPLCRAPGARARCGAARVGPLESVAPSAGGILHPRLHTRGRPIADKYSEGKMKSTLKREFKDLEVIEKELFPPFASRLLWQTLFLSETDGRRPMAIGPTPATRRAPLLPLGKHGADGTSGRGRSRTQDNRAPIRFGIVGHRHGKAQATRLETRTKESYLYARVWAATRYSQRR